MTDSPYRFRAIVLWILLLAGMILHFNYHVSKLFYGINVVRPGADGTIPFMAQLLKNAFYHLPMIFIVLMLYFKQKWFRLLLLLASLPYTVSHVFHVIGEFKKTHLDAAQIPLLSLMLIFSLLLNKTLWDYFRYEKNAVAIRR